MSQKTQQLLLQIARCEDVANCLGTQTSSPHSCSKIVKAQFGVADFQVPEPWSGDLENAPLLFVSSNPSIGEDVYPTESWSNDCIVDFFHNRFSGNVPTCKTTGNDLAPWTEKNGTRNLCPGGVYKNVAYWSSIRKRAAELMGSNVVPGQDYAITEVVHCKSEHEQGVMDAQVYCMGKFFERILCASGSSVLIVVGAVARRSMQCSFNILLNDEFEETTLCGRKRIVLTIPHPNARGGKKTVLDCIGEERLKKIQGSLNNYRGER